MMRIRIIRIRIIKYILRFLVVARKSSLFQSSKILVALEKVLEWLEEVLKWLEEVMNLPPNF